MGLTHDFRGVRIGQPKWVAIRGYVGLEEWFLRSAFRWVSFVEAGITVMGESAGRYALLRVPRPLRELLLYLRKAYHPTDFASGWVRGQEEFTSCLSGMSREMWWAVCS